MIKNGLELHNICELAPYSGGYILQRLPGPVREGMENFRTFKAEFCAGCEIRFVSDARVTQVTLKCLYNSGRITVFCGDVTYLTRSIKEGETVTLHLERPEHFEIMKKKEDEALFSPNVWRICLPAAKIVLMDVNTFGKSIRVPYSNEKPNKTFLAYGSSITQGELSTNNTLAYIHTAAALLGLDVLNLGFSGACFCEKVLADHISERDDWDFSLLELGVNMRTRFSKEEFSNRASYLINKVCTKHPDKKVFIVTIYPNAATWITNQFSNDEIEFNNILRKISGSGKYKNLTLLEGSRIMTHQSYLKRDMIHPSDRGHVEMGHNLADLLKTLL